MSTSMKHLTSGVALALFLQVGASGSAIGQATSPATSQAGPVPSTGGSGASGGMMMNCAPMQGYAQGQMQNYGSRGEQAHPNGRKRWCT